jgi:hypothetical protein
MRDGKLSRSAKEWLVAILVPIMLVAAWYSVHAVNREADENRLEVVCEIEQLNIDQLTALDLIGRSLGLPRQFEIPTRSEECRAVDASQ